MPTEQSPTTTRVRHAGRRPITRDTRGLLDTLAAIDDEGWDSEPATTLLTYVRAELVRPLAVDCGLRGRACAEAEATAWEAVWLELCNPRLRTSKSPWGVIWQTARRAVLGEILAARWGTDRRRAWELDAEERAGRCTRPIALEPLLHTGAECALPAVAPEQARPTQVSAALDRAADALVDSGWSAAKAREIVAEVAVMEEALGQGATVVGWRPLATRLELPPWQARRLTLVLRGSAERPGLLARLIADGPSAVRAPDVREALAGTLVRSSPTPTRAAVPAQDRLRPQGAANGRNPQLRALPRASSASASHT